LDSGAAISVVKKGLLPSPTPSKSKLKLKGVLPRSGTLYGPKQVTFQINNKKYDFPVYESEIEEDCILGLNFIQTYYCLCDPIKMILYISKPNYEEIKLQRSNKPPSVLFHTGSLYFTVRNSYVLDLQPKETRKLAVYFNADCEVTGSSQEVPLTSSKEKSSVSQSSDNTTT